MTSGQNALSPDFAAIERIGRRYSFATVEENVH